MVQSACQRVRAAASGVSVAVQTVDDMAGSAVRYSVNPSINTMPANWVAPNTRKIASNSQDRVILIFESHLIPRPNPERAETIDADTITSTAMPSAHRVGRSAVMIQSQPVIRCMPKANWLTP